MKISFLRSGLFIAWALFGCALTMRAQVATGTPPFGSFSGGPDIINNASVNAHIDIPVEVNAGRGMSFSYVLSYDSSVWYQTGGVWYPVANWGWRGVTEANAGYVSYAYAQGSCPTGTYPNFTWYYFHTWTSWVYHDAVGVPHYLPIALSDDQGNPCGPNTLPTSQTAATTDGSGYTMTASNSPSATTYLRSGAIINAPLLATTGTASLIDSNGNKVSTDTGTAFTQTTGNGGVTVSGSGTPSSPRTFTYTAASGGQATVTMNYTAYTVQSNFSCSGITEYGATSQNLVSSISLPDGTSYTFTYEITPGHAPNVTGRIASVRLPTGGTISYTYSGGSNGITCADGSTATLARATPDGTWTYAHTESGTAWTTTLTDPASNVITYNFQQVSGTQNVYETQRQVASLQTIYTCYGSSGNSAPTFPCNSTAVSLPITQRVVTTSIGGLEAQTVTNYDWNSSTSTSRGLPTEVDEYGYGSGAVGGLVRKTTTAYNTSLTNNIYDKPSTVSVYNGGGTLLRQAAYTYDGGSLTSTSGTPQHSNPSGSRGNPTTTQITGQGLSTLTKTLSFYDTGGTNVVTDLNGAQTTYNSGTGACGNSFATTTTMPMSMSQSMAWDCNSGLTTSSTDVNGKTTSFSYDNMNRPTQTSYPDGGISKVQYTSATVHDFCTLISGTLAGFCTASLARQDETGLDGLGRAIHQDLVNDPSGETYTDTTYDSLGRLYTKSNPYRSTSDPTYGKDTFTYDALNRVTKVTHTDGNYTQVSYGSGSQICAAGTYGYGYPALHTDESSNQRRTFTDGLGRVIEVDEPDPTNGNSLTLNTCNTYDAQGNLTSVIQGSETRSYSYDGLSRLTQETTPEGGTTHYYYTTSGGALCANDQKLVCRKTDARAITITYSYDALNRLTGKSYSNGDASVTYYYDQSSYNGLTITNGKGRRTGMSDGSGQTAWSYDTMGRVIAEERTIGSVTKTISYSYNLDGSLASITYPSGRVISYSYSNAARQLSAVDSANSIDYATSATYAPLGELAGVVNGYVSGVFNGITTSNSYNSRLFPTSLSASSSNGTALSLSYTYFANGNVNVETNGRDNGRTATYGYDALNRVTSASSQATSGADCWGESIPTSGFDRYANLLTINSTKCSSQALSLSVNTNNRITNSGFTYDAAGDLTADGVYSYGWNGEAHLTSANGVTYTYDGDLKRVKKSNGTLYWYCDSCGSVVAESDLSGNITSEYTLFNSQRIARRDVSSGNIYYIFSDPLGSYRTLTDSSGNVKGESDYYPFGGERVISSTVTDSFRFTGMEYDSEDGLNHTLYRQYTSAQGRWETTDPVRGCVMNPQGQNLYAYVKNNPTNVTDPSGLDPCDDPWYAINHNLECQCVAFGSEGCIRPPSPFPIPFPPIASGGGGGGSGGAVGLPGCDCYLVFGGWRGLSGCTYICNCPGDTLSIGYKKCSIFDNFASYPCPNYAIFNTAGELVFPSNFCGSSARAIVPPPPIIRPKRRR